MLLAILNSPKISKLFKKGTIGDIPHLAIKAVYYSLIEFFSQPECPDMKCEENLHW